MADTPAPIDFKPSAKSSWTSKYIDPKSLYINGYEQKPTGRSIQVPGGENYGPSMEAEMVDDLSKPLYAGTLNVNGTKYIGTFDSNGNFEGGRSDVTKGDYQQVLNQSGEVGYSKYKDMGMGFGDFVKMIAPIALNLIAPGAGAAIGGALGATGTAATMLGGAVLGGGTAALTGGNVLKGALTGGIGGAANLNIGDTGYTVGDLTKAANVVKAASNGDVFSALSGAANMSGLSTDIPIGDTGYMLSDLTKNAALAKAVMSGNPQAVVQAISKFAGAVQANSTNTPTEEQFNAQNQEFINSLAPYESTDPDYLMQLAVNDQQKSATANQAAVDAHTNDIIKQLEQAGLPQDTKGYWDEEHNVFVPSEFGGTTPAQTSEQVSGNPANMKDWSIDDKTGQWTWTNPATGEQTVYDYKTPITGTAQTGAQIENKAGAAPATSPSGTPKASTPTAGTPTAGTPTAGTPSSPTVTRVGVDPLEAMKMKNDVAHITPLEELFGGSIYNPAPASSAQHNTTSDADLMAALGGTQDDSGGGDVHALLQLLRS